MMAAKKKSRKNRRSVVQDFILNRYVTFMQIPVFEPPIILPVSFFQCVVGSLIHFITDTPLRPYEEQLLCKNPSHPEYLI